MKKTILISSMLLALSGCAKDQYLVPGMPIDCSKPTNQYLCCNPRLRCPVDGDVSACRMTGTENLHFNGEKTSIGQVYSNRNYFLVAVEAPDKDPMHKGFCQYQSMFNRSDDPPSYVRMHFGGRDGEREPLVARMDTSNWYHQGEDDSYAVCAVRMVDHNKPAANGCLLTIK